MFNQNMLLMVIDSQHSEPVGKLGSPEHSVAVDESVFCRPKVSESEYDPLSCHMQPTHHCILLQYGVGHRVIWSSGHGVPTRWVFEMVPLQYLLPRPVFYVVAQ